MGNALWKALHSVAEGFGDFGAALFGRGIGLPYQSDCLVCNTALETQRFGSAGRGWGQLRESDFRSLAEIGLLGGRQMVDDRSVDEEVRTTRDGGVHSDNSGTGRGRCGLNPKHIRAMKEGKTPYEKIPFDILADDAFVHAHGAEKYGERNWRIDKILASTYEGAILRHFFAWAGGEDIDPDSGRPHLNHIRACCAVVLDAQRHGTLIDDRDRKESKDVDSG